MATKKALTEVMPHGRHPINRLLRDSRLTSGLSQLEVANYLGLKSSQYISNIERGLCGPSVDAILKLSKLYRFNLHHVVDVMTDAYRGELERKLKVSASVRRKKAN